MGTRLDEHIERLRARGWDFGIAWSAVELIARSEDCRLTAYQCVAGVWTIGWGETADVSQGMHWTEDQADARFQQQLRRYAAKVEALCKVEPDANQLGAMTSLAYNIGLWRFAQSTALRRHNEGDFQAAARAFALWNKARVNGALTAVAGLTARRAREAALYLEAVGDAPRDPMPQAVETESKLSSSPIAQSGAITAGAGLLTGAAAAADQVKQASGILATIRQSVDKVADFIGLPPAALLAVGLVIVGVLVLQQRRKQRKQGWA